MHYEFTLHVEGLDDIDESMANAFFDACHGCCVPLLRGGKVFLGIQVPAGKRTKNEAVSEMIEKINRLGYLSRTISEDGRVGDCQ